MRIKITKEIFDYNFHKYGGFEKLHHMVENLHLTKYQIANHFKISHTTAANIIKDIWGKDFSLRIIRRESEIEEMIDLMKKYPLKKIAHIFRNENQDKVREALFLAFKQGIYLVDPTTKYLNFRRKTTPVPKILLKHRIKRWKKKRNI